MTEGVILFPLSRIYEVCQVVFAEAKADAFHAFCIVVIDWGWVLREKMGGLGVFALWDEAYPRVRFGSGLHPFDDIPTAYLEHEEWKVALVEV